MTCVRNTLTSILSHVPLMRQMAVDYGALEGDRSRPKLTAPIPDRYDEAVLIRTRAFVL